MRGLGMPMASVRVSSGPILLVASGSVSAVEPIGSSRSVRHAILARGSLLALTWGIKARVVAAGRPCRQAAFDTDVPMAECLLRNGPSLNSGMAEVTTGP